MRRFVISAAFMLLSTSLVSAQSAAPMDPAAMAQVPVVATPAGASADHNAPAHPHDKLQEGAVGGHKSVHGVHPHHHKTLHACVAECNKHHGHHAAAPDEAKFKECKVACHHHIDSHPSGTQSSGTGAAAGKTNR